MQRFSYADKRRHWAAVLLAPVLAAAPLLSLAQAAAAVRVDDAVKWRLEMQGMPVAVFVEHVRKSKTSPPDAKEVEKVCGDCRFEVAQDAQGGTVITVSSAGPTGPVLGQSGYDSGAINAQKSATRTACPPGQVLRGGKCSK